MKRSTGSKPTAYDKAQIYTLLIGTLGAGANPITTPLLTTPATPQQLEATALSASSIYLEWSSTGENTVNYEVERSEDDVTYALIATVPVGVTVYTDIDLTAATLYYYRVRATNLNAQSPYSNVASATTLVFPTTGILDTFDRPNEGPPPSASWFNYDANSCVVSGNACHARFEPNSGTAGWGATFGPDCEVWGVIAVVPTTTKELRLQARVPIGYTHFYDGYEIGLYDAGVNDWRVYFSAPSADFHEASVATPVAGSAFGASFIGTAIKVYYRATSSAAWVEMVSTTNAEVAAAGYIGVYTIGNGAFDTFGGGTI